MTAENRPGTVPPVDRQALLAAVGPAEQAIYRMVRQLLDDLEIAAPWQVLYYPPPEIETFIRQTSLLVAVIGELPSRVTALSQHVEDMSPPVPERLRSDLDFFFHGIFSSVDHDLEVLDRHVEQLRRRDEVAPTAAHLDHLAELSADVKGKVSSSAMGACASLVAEGRWQGVEIEPILFAEKAEEFDRNEQLVRTLTEVIETIQGLFDEVPLGELVDAWRQGQRADQYALSPLYILLGNLGRLMKESSRRALYSGDYHQVQRRHSLLESRVAELIRLHNIVWGTVEGGDSVDRQAVGQVMVRKAIQLAAIVSVDRLRDICGGKQVADVLAIVVLEKELSPKGDGSTPHPARERLPEELRPLVPLLYDEDLITFLELLLGSVLKRASLSVRRQLRADSDTATGVVAGAVAEGVVEVDSDDDWSWEQDDSFQAKLDSLPTAPLALDGEALEPPSTADHVVRIDDLQDLAEYVRELRSRANPERKSFELIARLSRQRRTIPAAMYQSMHPYLFELMNGLIPKLNQPGVGSGLFERFGVELINHCQALCRPNPTAEQLTSEVPLHMQRVVELLDAVHVEVVKLMAEIERATSEA